MWRSGGGGDGDGVAESFELRDEPSGVRLGGALTPSLGHARIQHLCWESETIHVMARKSYTDEFRRQAVDLYESTPGATLRGIADDLGLARGTLADWLKTFGTGSTTAPITSPKTTLGRPETTAEKMARLEAEVAQLRADKAKIETEKTILRQAAKYFAGETNW